MNPIEERLNAIDARLSARAAELEQRIAARFGDGKPSHPQGGPLDGGARYGLFFGVGTYAPSMKIEPCPRFADDVRNLRNACVRYGGWLSGNITLKLNEAATVSGISDSIASLARRAKAGDIVLLCISTHGGHIPNAKTGGNDTFLCAHDGYYTEAQMRRDILGFAAGVRVIFLLESCFAAGMFEKAGGGKPLATFDSVSVGETLSSFTKDIRAGGERLQPGDFAWIAAAAADQSSLYAGGSGNLMLSHTFLNEGWIGGGADGFVRAVVSANGEQAVMSPDALLRVRSIAPAFKNGGVSFLDLAAFSTWRWKDVADEKLKRHVPRFGNAPLLSAVFAGRTGADSFRSANGAPETFRVGESSPAESVPDATPAAVRASGFGSVEKPGTRYGIFAGVNNSPPNPVLHGCVNDAKDLRNACVELGGWERGNAIVLEDASMREFLDALSQLAFRAKAGDALLVSFSGHGGASGDQQDNDFSFAFADGALSEKDFRKALSAFNPGVRIVVVVDACHSDAAAVASPAATAMLPNVGWITASTCWQSSQDSFQGSRKNGFLTGAILDGWRNGGAAGIADHMKAPASGGQEPGTVSFLDLAVFVAHSWRYWHPDEQQPQYHNPAILSAVTAGRVGA